MIPLAISQNLSHWAARAGYAVTPVDPSGGVVFWTDPGGEVRVYLREDSSGWVTVSSADRAEVERFDLSADCLDVAERYLWKFFGDGVRSKLKLPFLHVPKKMGEEARGYRTECDRDFVHLIDPCGKVIAKARAGVIGTMRLVSLSYFVSASLSDVEATYLDVCGRPLFSQ